MNTFQKIMHAINNASNEDYENGLNWYGNAQELAQNYSDTWNISIWKSSGILSALSPQLSWGMNILAAERIISDLATTGKLDAKKSKYLQTSDCIDKAVRIFHAENDSFTGILEFFRITKSGAYSTGYKTLSFYCNIADPELSTIEISIKKTIRVSGVPVTIDRHILNYLQGNKPQSNVLRNKEYFKLWNVFESVAKKLSLLPCQVQAIVWNYYRSQQNYFLYEKVPF